MHSREIPLLWNIYRSFRFALTLFPLSNRVKKRNHYISEAAHEAELRKTAGTYISLRSSRHPHSSINSRFLACESKICLLRWLTLNFRRFDWISAASRKVLNLLRVHFGILRFWSFCGNNVRLFKISQVKNTQASPLEVHFKCTVSGLEKSSVKPPFMITYTC